MYFKERLVTLVICDMGIQYTICEKEEMSAKCTVCGQKCLHGEEAKSAESV